jgi:Na+-transporting NADH:ubiquinone oxidoreductase subunit NqrB
MTQDGDQQNTVKDKKGLWKSIRDSIHSVHNSIRLKDITEQYRKQPIGEKLPDILDYLKLWHKMALFLRLVHIFLGILATFFSLLAAAQIGFVDNEQARIFAFIAAVSIALMTAFNLGAKSNDTRAAWRQLNAAVIKYNNGLCKEQAVIDAYIQGERRIGDVSYQNK